MAIFKLDQLDALDAGADLSDSLNLCATITSGKLVLAGDNGIFYGSIYEGAVADKPVTVQTSGIAKIIASGAITAGARVACAANGQVKAGTTNAFGTARSTVANQGEVVEVLLD